MRGRIAEIWSAKKASPSHGRIGRTELREILRSTITARASIHFAPESREQPLESIKTPVISPNILVFYAVDPTKRRKLASASTLTIIPGENVPSAKTTLPLPSRSFYNDRPLPSS